MVSYDAAVGCVSTVSKCTGLLPCTSSGPHQKARRLAALFSNFLMLSLVLISLGIDVRTSKWHSIDFSRLLRRTNIKGSFVLNMGIHIFWQIWKPQRMQKCLRRLRAFTIILGDRNYTCFNIFILIFCLISFSVVPIYYNYFKRFTLYDAIVGWGMPILTNIVFTTQCFTFLEVIHCHFAKLNRVTISLARDFELYIRIHAELCAITKDLNQMYHVQLLMAFVELLGILVTRWFQLFESLTTGEPYEGFLVTAPWFIAAKVIQMWSLCLISYEVYHESDAFTDNLCYAARMKKYPPPYSRKLFLYLAMRPSVKITACHAFVIDTGVLATVLGATMTYFIVLVQLK